MTARAGWGCSRRTVVSKTRWDHDPTWDTRRSAASTTPLSGPVTLPFIAISTWSTARPSSAILISRWMEWVQGSAVTMTIPAFLRYDLREVNGEWKIATLRAYWELPSMMLQFLRNGASAVPATIQLSQGLIRNQRLRGTAGFAAGFRRVGSRRKQLVDSFVNAVGRGDRLAAQRVLSSDATMTFGDDDAADIADLVARCPGASAPKLIAAGSTVAASITSTQGRGVMFADVARRRNEIRRIRYFPASSTSDAADKPK